MFCARFVVRCCGFDAVGVGTLIMAFQLAPIDVGWGGYGANLPPIGISDTAQN